MKPQRYIVIKVGHRQYGVRDTVEDRMMEGHKKGIAYTGTSQEATKLTAWYNAAVEKESSNE